MLPDSQWEKQHRMRSSKEYGVVPWGAGEGDRMILQDERHNEELRKAEIPGDMGRH